MPFFLVLYSKNHQSSPICTPTRSFVRSVVVSTTKVFARERSIYNIRIGYHPRESRAPKAPTRARAHTHACTAQVSAYESRCNMCVFAHTAAQNRKLVLLYSFAFEPNRVQRRSHAIFVYLLMANARTLVVPPRRYERASTAAPHTQAAYLLWQVAPKVCTCVSVCEREGERERVCLCVCLCWPGRLPQHGRCAGECVRALGV